VVDLILPIDPIDIQMILHHHLDPTTTTLIIIGEEEDMITGYF